MTREEAIEQLQNCKDLIKQNGQDYLDERDFPLLDMAIEALQREEAEAYGYCHRIKPKQDLISRVKLFNKLATVQAPPEANEYKAEVYKIIQSMGTEEENDEQQTNGV